MLSNTMVYILSVWLGILFAVMITTITVVGYYLYPMWGGVILSCIWLSAILYVGREAVEWL